MSDSTTRTPLFYRRPELLTPASHGNLRIRSGGYGFASEANAVPLAIIEFGAAMLLGQGADEFLGTQGDPWDTQWDMLMCLLGAIAALALLSRLHDRQLADRGAPRFRSP